MTPPPKISPYSPTDLKSTTDDYLPTYLTTLPKPYAFTQSHTTSTIRLLLGYTAVLIAGALFAYDYKTSWAESKPYTLPACAAYFMLNGALTYWIYFKESGMIFQGKRDGGQELTIRSRGKKHSDQYTLEVTYSAPKTGKKWEEKTVTGSFTRWFSREGYLQKKELIAWLAENVEVLGLAEKERGGASHTEKQRAVEVSGAQIFEASRSLDIRSADGGVITVEPVTPGTAKKGKGGRKKA